MKALDKMRQKQQALAKPQETVPSPQKKVKQLLPVKYACGHEAHVADIAGKACGSCRAETQRKKVARKHATRQAKQAAKDPSQTCGRLPNRSTFNVRYDADKQEWYGTLNIDLGQSNEVFTGSAGGVFKLLQNLDKQYRDHLRGLQGTP
jgi:hypothetical protein